MKQMKTVTRPARTTQVLDFIRCELCGTQTQTPSCWSDYEIFHQDEVTIQREEGKNYPEGSGQRIVVDLCSTCFQNKLLPWIVAQGGTPRTEDWSW